MITKKFIESVRELIPRTPAEKKKSIFLYSSSRLSYFQPRFDTEFFKKKKLLHVKANVGFQVILS